MRRTVALAAAVALVVVAAAGCGGSSGGGKTTRTGPKLTAPPVKDAAALRDRLLKLAKKHVADTAGKDGTFGIAAAWQKRFPKLTFSDSQVAAGPSTVSGSRFNPASSTNPPSKDNPPTLGFAVADTKGTCAGGLIKGYPKPDSFEPISMDGAKACTGATVTQRAANT